MNFWKSVSALSEEEKRFLFSVGETNPSPKSISLLHAVRTKEELHLVRIKHHVTPKTQRYASITLVFEMDVEVLCCIISSRDLKFQEKVHRFNSCQTKLSR